MRRRIRVRSGPALLLAGVLSALYPLISGSREARQAGGAPAELASSRGEARHSPRFSGATLTGKVIRVLDGDTIEVLQVEGATKTPVRIRMTGIDAPEKSQPFGEKCRENLAAMIAGREATIDLRGTDRYSRALGVVLLQEPPSGGAPSTLAPPKDINLAQIASGCAWHYKQYQKQQKPEERRAYSEAEVSARTRRLGLWRDPSPQPPWQYRREGRGSRRRGRSR